jgi:hypothetical protein
MRQQTGKGGLLEVQAHNIVIQSMKYLREPIKRKVGGKYVHTLK